MPVMGGCLLDNNSCIHKFIRIIIVYICIYISFVLNNSTGQGSCVASNYTGCCEGGGCQVRFASRGNCFPPFISHWVNIWRTQDLIHRM